jgi:hypothetical protein
MGRMAALFAVIMLAAMAAAGVRVRNAHAVGEGTFSIATTGTTVMEGTTAYITINRTGGTNFDQVIQLTVTPNAPATYTDIGGYGNGYTTIAFAAGQSSRTIDVATPGTGLPTNDDVTNQGVRTITIVLSSVVSGGGTIGSPNSHTLTINDNDGPSKYSYTLASSSVTEGTGGGTQTVNIAVTRSGATNNTETVQCTDTLTGTAAPGGIDYTMNTQTLTFNPGDTSKNCTLTVVRDNLQEGNQTVVLGFGAVGGGDFPGGVGTNPTHTLTIVDDDGTGTVQFQSSTYSAAESGGTASFAVTRTGGSNGTINANCSTVSQASATAGLDYTTVTNQLLSWGDGNTTTQYCQVAILPDALVEGPETFGLTLTGSNVGIQNSATVTITDDDGIGSLQFSATSYSGVENGGAITLTVTRTGSTVGTVSVDIATTSVGSTATAGVDYVSNSTTLIWGNGDGTVKTFTVSPIDDAVVEGTEYVNVTLTNATGGATIGSPSTAQVLITDNESPFPVITSLSPSAGTIFGGTFVTISGANFTGATSVTFGGLACTSLNVLSANTITCVTPAQSAGTVEVVVNTPSGSNTTIGSANDYTYTGGPTITSLNPATGPASGNTIVTITGTNFTSSGMVVKFDTTTAVFSFIDTETIVAVAPAHSGGTVDVSVTTPGGASPNTAADDYIYTGASNPVITLLSPSSGPVGTTVVITGSGFSGATLVSFGGVAATYTVNSDAQITASVPSGTPAGVVDVRVTTGSGTSPNTSADNFTNTSASPTITYTLYFRFTLIVWTGPNGISALAALKGQENPDNPATNNVSTLVGAIWRFDATTQTFKGYFPGSDGVPGANDFTTLTTGVGYFVALLNPGTVTWTTLGAN